MNPLDKFLVLGSTGMLGQSVIKKLQSQSINYLQPSSLELNLTRRTDIIDYIYTHKPNCIINCAANVNLQHCEDNPTKALQVNATPSKHILSCIDEIPFKYVYISTDHYYTNENSLKHSENHPIELLNSYSKSKYEGEQFALKNKNSLCLRTNIIGFRNNLKKPTFIEWAINSILTDTHIYLFDDFFTSPISTNQFVKYMFMLINNNESGVINLASSTVSNKKDFILMLAKKLGVKYDNFETKSITTLKGLKRANSLGLNVEKCESILKCKLPDMTKVIEQVVSEYHKLKNEK